MRFSSESWSFWTGVLAVGLTALAAVTGVVAWYFSTQATHEKDERLAHFQDESRKAVAAADARAAEANQAAKNAEANLASANERAAEANARAMASEALVASANAASRDAVARVAEAQSASAQAIEKAESFRLDIARANERAAAANATAERERLARLQLEARLADRIVHENQRLRLKAAFAKIKGETVEIGVFGDSMEIAGVAGAIRECLIEAGVLLHNFSPLGGGSGVQGVLIGTSPDAPSAVKLAAESFVTILRETLGDGVGPWDFAQLTFPGNAMTSSSEGALPFGKGPLRIWIGGK